MNSPCDGFRFGQVYVAPRGFCQALPRMQQLTFNRGADGRLAITVAQTGEPDVVFVLDSDHERHLLQLLQPGQHAVGVI